MHTKYKTIIWDCDGVLLNSNKLKTEAFRSTTISFGESASSALVDYHLQNGGLSRYSKYKYFVEVILPHFCPHGNLPDKSQLLHSLLLQFASLVESGLKDCEVATNLCELRTTTPDSVWFVVSGSDESELRNILQHHSIDHLFNGGIYGSPSDKYEIIESLLHLDYIKYPVLFIGDSKIDHQVSSFYGFDFLFVTQWTSFGGWQEYCDQHMIRTVPIASAIKFL